MKTVSAEYIMGILEGREILEKYGTANISIADRIANLRSTMKGFSRSSPVGQMLLGELDFWRGQAQRRS